MKRSWWVNRSTNNHHSDSSDIRSSKITQPFSPLKTRLLNVSPGLVRNLFSSHHFFNISFSAQWPEQCCLIFAVAGYLIFHFYLHQFPKLLWHSQMSRQLYHPGVLINCEQKCFFQIARDQQLGTWMDGEFDHHKHQFQSSLMCWSCSWYKAPSKRAPDFRSFNLTFDIPGNTSSKFDDILECNFTWNVCF